MTNRERLEVLLQNAFTINTLEHQLQLWRECMEYSLYHTTTTDVVEAASRYGVSLAATDDREIVSSWPADIWNGVQADNFTAVYKGMVLDIASLATLVLYLPAKLSDDDVAELGVWCRAEFSIDVLEIKIDPKVVGGVGFIDAGQQYQEISWRSKLLAAPEVVAQVIARHV